MVEHEECPAGVVTAEEVEHSLQRLGGVAFHQVLDTLIKLGCSQWGQLAG